VTHTFTFSRAQQHAHQHAIAEDVVVDQRFGKSSVHCPKGQTITTLITVGQCSACGSAPWCVSVLMN
jgi:pyrimidine deaminase RibD-like protein